MIRPAEHPEVAMEAYEGKAKIVRIVGEDDVEIFYKDDATAFNGQKHEQFAGKGALNSRITELLFRYLEDRGVPTHHRGRLDERTLAARRVQIVPLEVVVRFLVAGSLQKRTGLDYLTPCDPPIVEFYYKRDDLGDPLLNDEHIRLLGLATEAEVSELGGRSVAAARHLQSLFAGAGIDLVDLKFEFGRTPDGLLLADEISPDTCRFRDAETGEILDKDLFRFGKGDLVAGYRTLLERLEAALPGAV
jgi:phosphoribosylaminoimidazole-succinocarboxamide synthase